jgi:anti-sigma-K factor RskA
VDISAYISSGILESYVLDQLNEEERAAVKVMATKHPEIQAEIVAIEKTLERYAKSHSKTPSDNLKKKIASQLKFEDPSIIPITFKPKKGKLISKHWLIAASIALLISIGYNVFLYSELVDAHNEFMALDVDKQYFAEQFEIQKTAYDDAKRHLDIVAQNGNKTVILKGLDNAPNAIASVYWNQSSKEVYLNISELPTPPDSKQYQLWAIVSGKPVDAGIFDLPPNSNTIVLQKMKPVADAQAFAVTLEKKGGTSVPTLNAMYLLGNV